MGDTDDKELDGTTEESQYGERKILDIIKKRKSQAILDISLEYYERLLRTIIRGKIDGRRRRSRGRRKTSWTRSISQWTGGRRTMVELVEATIKNDGFKSK